MTAAVARSRRGVAWVLRVTAASCGLVSIAHPLLVGGPSGALTLPVILQVLLVLAAVEVSSGLRSGLRIDALSLFTAWEALRGCVAPVIIQYVGSGSAGYYRFGTYEDGRLVLFVGNLFFAVVIGTRLVAAAVARATSRAGGVTGGEGAAHSSDGEPEQAALSRQPFPVWPLIGAGLVGVVIRFPTVTSVALFFTGDVDALQSNSVISSSGLLLASLFLRPLFVAGVVIAMHRRRRDGRTVAPLLLPLAFGIVFCLASYGLNRATVAFTLIAFALVLVERSSRMLRLVPTVATVAALGGFFLSVGSLRSTLWGARTGLEGQPLGVVPALQSVLAYAASPMQLGAVLPTVRTASPFGPQTLLHSVVSPVPGAPAASRTGSGTAVYNNIAYHSFDGKDQLLPSWFEGYISFGVIGVVVVAVVLGILMAVGDVLRRRSRTVLGTFAATLLTLWLTQAGTTAIGVIEQNTINFVLTPALVAGFVGASRALRARRRAFDSPRKASR